MTHRIRSLEDERLEIQQSKEAMEACCRGGALSIVVFGASGDLAMKKTFPSLFSLFSAKFLPCWTVFVGFARTQMTHDEFRQKVASRLKNADPEQLAAFQSHLFYVNGLYDSTFVLSSLPNKGLKSLKRRYEAPLGRVGRMGNSAMS